MKTIRTEIILFIFVSLALLCIVPVAYGSSKLTGTVTEKQGDRVRVDFTPHKSFGPSKGDQVGFVRIFQGIEAKAGKGEVVEVGSGFAWVRITSQPVKLKMTGIIALTENSKVVTEKQGTQVSKDENKKSRQPHSVKKKEPVKVSRSPQELKKAVVLELVRLHYLPKDVSDVISKTDLEQVLLMFYMDHNKRHDKVSELLLKDLQAVGD